MRYCEKAQILKEKTGVTYPLLIPDAGNMNGRIMVSAASRNPSL